MTLYFILMANGLLAISILTIGGAIASRKFNFKYSSLSFLSISLHLSLSITATLFIDATAAVTLGGIFGLFEAVVAWKWIKKFKANLGDMEAELDEMLDENYNPEPIVVLILVAGYMFLAWLGALLA